jgi:hypothetical protein
MKSWRIPTGTLATGHGGQALDKLLSYRKYYICFQPLCNHEFFSLKNAKSPIPYRAMIQ